MTLPPASLAPRVCRDFSPWLKECVLCGHMKALSAFPIQGNRRAHSFGGTQRLCVECCRVNGRFWPVPTRGERGRFVAREVA